MESVGVVSKVDVFEALKRVALVLQENRQSLIDLDQEIGDGDLGITMSKIAEAALDYTSQPDNDTDIGRCLIEFGMQVNRVAASTMGTLVATALMRAGKEVDGALELKPPDLSNMLYAAAKGIQHRGKAELGDKTILDAVFPAASAFEQAISEKLPIAEACWLASEAAAAGRDEMTPLQSKRGRAAWVGERTIGKVDAGCEMAVVILRALARSHVST